MCIRDSTYTDNYVNPLEMDVWSLDPNDSKGMVREKGEFMLCLLYTSRLKVLSDSLRQSVCLAARMKMAPIQ